MIQGDQHLFPVKRLSPDADALPLPFLLQQPTRKIRVLGSLIILLFPIGLILWGWLRYQALFPTPDTTSLQLMASGAVMTIVIFIDLYYSYKALREKMFLTEEGNIRVEMWHSRRVLPWEEARLFALDGCIVRGRKSFTLLFELASSHEVISCESVIHMNTSMPLQSDQSFFSQGLDLQLDGILSLIAGRTGLTFYDLQEYKVRKSH